MIIKIQPYWLVSKYAALGPKLFDIIMIHWIIGKFYTKNQGPNSKEEKVITLPNRYGDIVAYKGNVCNQKVSPRVHCTIGGLHSKN